MTQGTELEHKFCSLDLTQTRDPMVVQGYASLFGECDQGGDIVAHGAYGASLTRLAASGRQVKMLWQHDPAQPIGVWTEVFQDDRGLFVKGRLLPAVARAHEASELIAAGAIDGLSIGYRTLKSHKNAAGQRVLTQIDLWEVSLVTFPMLPTARVAAKSQDSDWQELTDILRQATRNLAQD